MKASVILAHPYALSFNHAIFAAACKTLTANNIPFYCHDLYRERFDPVLTENELGKKTSADPLVALYAKELLESDVLVFIHPNWWGQPPAILKGYIDRVIRPPYAYDFPPEDSGGGLPIGKLKGKFGLVFNTANTEQHREENYFHDPLDSIWERCVFGFCGIEQSERKTFRIVADSTEAERSGWLDDVRATIENVLRRIHGQAIPD